MYFRWHGANVRNRIVPCAFNRYGEMNKLHTVWIPLVNALNS